VAFLTRFGGGILPDRSTVIQQGDQLYFTLTDDISASVHQAAGAAPEGSH
jgi:trk system potassium uptake protein TrkA